MHKLNQHLPIHVEERGCVAAWSQKAAECWLPKETPGGCEALIYGPRVRNLLDLWGEGLNPTKKLLNREFWKEMHTFKCIWTLHPLPGGCKVSAVSKSQLHPHSVMGHNGPWTVPPRGHLPPPWLGCSCCGQPAGK